MITIIKKIFKCIVNLLTALIFACLVLIIAAKVVMLFNGKEYFEIFGYSIFDVATGSMEPAISQNDVIIVNSKAKYNIGDIITYKKDGEFITHRIEAIGTDYIITKGDANNTADPGIGRDVIIGKVIKIIDNGGVWEKIFTTPSIIISIFITLIAFDFAFSYKGVKNKSIAKKVDNLDLKQIQNASPFNDSSDIDIDKLYNKIDMIKEKKDVTFDKKEKEFLDYTIRLDLKELNKGIAKKLKEEENDSK